jgi:hypothetical protein
MPHKDLLDPIARQTAAIYSSEPNVYITPLDWSRSIAEPPLTGELSLNAKIEAATIGEAAIAAMAESGLDIKDLELQRSIARRAIKYIPDYQLVNQRRHRTAKRLNDSIH